MLIISPSTLGRLGRRALERNLIANADVSFDLDLEVVPRPDRYRHGLEALHTGAVDDRAAAILEHGADGHHGGFSHATENDLEIDGHAWTEPSGIGLGESDEEAENLLPRCSSLPHIRLLGQLFDHRDFPPVAPPAAPGRGHEGVLPGVHAGDVHLADLAAHLHPGEVIHPDWRPSRSHLVAQTVWAPLGEVVGIGFDDGEAVGRGDHRALVDLLIEVVELALRLFHVDAGVFDILLSVGLGRCKCVDGEVIGGLLVLHLFAGDLIHVGLLRHHLRQGKLLRPVGLLSISELGSGDVVHFRQPL